MQYKEALDFLYSRHAKDMKLGLEHIRDLLHRLGNPQDQLKAIHIAGTNGKGSTAAILESVLRSADYKTGLYTSPHLICLNERIQISGIPISDASIFQYLQIMRSHAEASDASFFEIMTAMAFLCFADQKVDIAVIETGLGGRLDATNTLTPVLTIITEIGLDHTKILGKELISIAGEKAGILKYGIPFVCGSTNFSVRSFFRKRAIEKGVPFIPVGVRTTIDSINLEETGSIFNLLFENQTYENLHLGLIGNHQIDNCMTAITAIQELQNMDWHITEADIRDGLSNVKWPARLDLLQSHPKILLDSAHNPMGMKRLAEALTNIFNYQKLILIYGVLSDKNYHEMAELIVPLADTIILTRPNNERALMPEKLVELSIFSNKSVECIPDISEAYHAALDAALRDDLICVTGSLYFVGEVLHEWRRINL